jgi:DNA-binding MarR family transcriptional regulator
MNTQPAWSFLTTYGLVLTCIGQKGQMTAHEIAMNVGVTERTVRKIIKELEQTGYIHTTKDGRQNCYKVNSVLPMGHALQRDISVGDLLKVLTAKN